MLNPCNTAFAVNPTQQYAVSLKLPMFWTSQPQVWFQQAEAQFHIRRITADDTKYYYVVSALDQEPDGRLVHYLQTNTKASKLSMHYLITPQSQVGK